jgi:hypothetical protein
VLVLGIAGVPPAIFPNSIQCKNAGETPALHKACVPMACVSPISVVLRNKG